MLINTKNTEYEKIFRSAIPILFGQGILFKIKNRNYVNEFLILL